MPPSTDANLKSLWLQPFVLVACRRSPVSLALLGSTLPSLGVLWALTTFACRCIITPTPHITITQV